MARSLRLVVPGHPLHLIQHGNNRQAVFFGEDDDHRFLSDVTQAAGKYRCAVHASVLITNHLHLLVTPGEGGRVSSLMQALWQPRDDHRRHRRSCGDCQDSCPPRPRPVHPRGYAISFRRPDATRDPIQSGSIPEPTLPLGPDPPNTPQCVAILGTRAGKALLAG